MTSDSKASHDGSVQQPKIWIDADTGNEVDDPYAIARLIAEPERNVVGLSSVHFNNADLVTFEYWNQYPTKNIQTVEISQELNREILFAMGREAINHPLGADRQIGRAWGETTPRPSPATESLIHAVKSLEVNETLDVICLGALTNIASAALIDPTILPRLRCYILGAKYDLAKNVWDKNEFNIRNDLNAFDYLLNDPNVNLTIMPTGVAHPFQFERDAVYSRMNDSVPIQRLLKTRWQETTPDDTTRILWDLALVEAYLLPHKATIVPVLTPPENTQRMIHVYTDIDVSFLRDDFWSVICPIQG